MEVVTQKIQVSFPILQNKSKKYDILQLVIHMKKEYEFNDIKYTIEKDLDLFDYDLFKDLVTDYFNNYDYIFADEAYNKIRLKGFCDKTNKIFKKNNDISTLDDYITNYCAYNCKWCLLKKVKPSKNE